MKSEVHIRARACVCVCTLMYYIASIKTKQKIILGKDVDIILRIVFCCPSIKCIIVIYAVMKLYKID